MGYELIKRKMGKDGIASDNISVTTEGFSFGEKWFDYLSNFVEIYIDESEKKVAFKTLETATENSYSSKCYPNSKSRNHKRYYVKARKLVKSIPHGRYKAFLEENGFIAFKFKNNERGYNEHMAFELLESKTGVEGIPSNVISVSKTAVAFGDDFYPLLNREGNVEIYLDRETNQVGFRPTTKTKSSFKIRTDKVKHGGSKRTYMASTKLNKLISKGRYVGRFNPQGLIVIDVNEIADDKKESADTLIDKA